MPWSIVPFVNNVEMTKQAVADLVVQERVGEARVLIVGVGVSPSDRETMEKFAALHGEAVLCWWHSPALPSLSATWNRALRFCWEQGEQEALVANNDVRVTCDTYATLREIMAASQALLVTATGVEEEETMFEEARRRGQAALAYDETGQVRRGGPGFSLFMISREAHEKYPFDENLIPAFCEDADWHRRAMLGGDGERVFGTNVRYLHLGGQTLKAMPEARRLATERQIAEVCRPYYARKWGGGVNEETFIVPFQLAFHGAPLLDENDRAGHQAWVVQRYDRGEPVTTPALFDEVRRVW